MADYFRSSTTETDKAARRSITQNSHSKLSDVFTGIGCFEGLFELRKREGSCPYQAPPRTVAYALQQPLKERLQKQQIIVPLDVDETPEWSNNFILFSKADDKVWLCHIADDLLIAGLDELGRDHDATLDKLLKICRDQSKTQQRQVPFQIHQHSLT